MRNLENAVYGTMALSTMTISRPLVHGVGLKLFWGRDNYKSNLDWSIYLFYLICNNHPKFLNLYFTFQNCIFWNMFHSKWQLNPPSPCLYPFHTICHSQSRVFVFSQWIMISTEEVYSMNIIYWLEHALSLQIWCMIKVSSFVFFLLEGPFCRRLKVHLNAVGKRH